MTVQEERKMPVATGTIIPTECWTPPPFWLSTWNSFLEIVLKYPKGILKLVESDFTTFYNIEDYSLTYFEILLLYCYSLIFPVTKVSQHLEKKWEMCINYKQHGSL